MSNFEIKEDEVILYEARLSGSLLELNNMVSLLDLKTDKPILVFDPTEVMELLNEAMIMEGLIE